MAKRIKKSERLPEDRPAALGELIHAQVRAGIETAMVILTRTIEQR